MGPVPVPCHHRGKQHPTAATTGAPLASPPGRAAQEEAERAAVVEARGFLVLRALDNAVSQAQSRVGNWQEPSRKRARTENERQLAARELAALQSRVAAATGLLVFLASSAGPVADG